MSQKSSFKTIEEYRDYCRKYREKNREKLRLYNLKYNRIWRARNGNEHDLARTKVKYAVDKGILIRLPCEVCGDFKSQGHHEDYTKPLEVIWLCTIHHKEKHME